MSMWSKTSESSVENSFAYVMEQVSNLQFFTSNFAQEMNLDTKIGLNLDNEIDFRSVNSDMFVPALQNVTFWRATRCGLPKIAKKIQEKAKNHKYLTKNVKL